jgi:NADPH2:quinone reductase
MKKDHNSGDDIAGVVKSLGPDVIGFSEGDRVAAFHVMLAPHGAFAEYAIAPAHTVFAIPTPISFEEAATIPLAAYTAAVSLFVKLELPSPWDVKSREKSDNKKRPLIVYGASSTVGAFAIKLAKVAGIHPIIAVGSSNSAFVEPFLDKEEGDCMLDYRSWKSPADMVTALQDAVRASGVEDGRVWDVFDGISEKGTWDVLSQAIAGPQDATGRKPRIVVVWPGRDYSAADPTVEILPVDVGYVHGKAEGQRLFGLVWGQAFARGLNQGWLKAHPFEVVEGGLDTGLSAALKSLRDGTVKGKKVVIQVSNSK